MGFFHIVHVIYWVSVKTKFTIIMIHYCNFCLNTQPVSSKLQYNSFNISTYTSTTAKSLRILKAVVRTRNLESQLTEQMLNRMSLMAPKEKEVDIYCTRKHFEMETAQVSSHVYCFIWLQKTYNFCLAIQTNHIDKSEGSEKSLHQTVMEFPVSPRVSHTWCEV